jgi:hypothetical protein
LAGGFSPTPVRPVVPLAGEHPLPRLLLVELRDLGADERALALARFSL